MKKILGLDLGTTSIGWALVNEAESSEEKSSIIKLGVRVNPLTTDEQINFEKGKSITGNAERTLKRSMRRNLQRYKLRRSNLIEVLKSSGILLDEIVLTETNNRATFQTYENRAEAAVKKIELVDLVRVLLMLNKKRGYKSSRKAKSHDEGHLIDGMEVAKRLYDDNITPGQFVLRLFAEGKNYIPDFYRSDLQSEFDLIWKQQQQFYPEVFNNSGKDFLLGKNKRATADFFTKHSGITLPEFKGDRTAKRLRRYQLRSKGIDSQLTPGEAAEVLIEINGDIAASSGYLGSISDRSKELIFKKLTVGQYLWAQVKKDPHARLKGQVFYRQDYLDEFEAIWSEQSKHHHLLTNELKSEIRDVIIFYQRRLKSQKGLISFCQFENRKVKVIIDGKEKQKTIGLRVCPKSSPLFQEFKIWQVLNNIEVINKSTSEKTRLQQDDKEILFTELNVKGELRKAEALKILFENPQELDLNYEKIEGNRTAAAMYSAYNAVIEASGHEELNFNKLTAGQIKNGVAEVFDAIGINKQILDFNGTLEGKDFERQLSYQLWHLLYSFEDDSSATGDENLRAKLTAKFGIPKEYTKLVAGVTFQPDYGSLSSKALRKILPFLQGGNEYDEACVLAGYNHSGSKTAGERLSRQLKDKMEILPKNSLRNPVVEKIINQMTNVVNAVIDEYGKPDEIRIELARELKKSAEERKAMSDNINRANEEHERIRIVLKNEFGLQFVSRNDIIRYKLWKELEYRGYKTLYTNTYISPEELFSKKFDIEHIIPQSRLFDDSFSNKTLEARDANIEKGDETAFDYVKRKYGAVGLEQYVAAIEDFQKQHGDKVKAKKKKLLLTREDIPENFIARDLRDTQYIARKAKELLEEVFRTVNTTTGSVTDRLREDWQLVDIMQELNWDKYKALGLTYYETNKDGQKIAKIKDWTKRNDHRHHAMDALTVAFTKQNHIQYLNNLNARSEKNKVIYGIEQNELRRDEKNKLRFKPPIPLDEFRALAKEHLQSILVSHKAKNKIVTKNRNKIKVKGGALSRTELTPRGQLHLETVYGSIKRYITTEIKIGGSSDRVMLNKVAKKKYRDALLKRLEEFGGDAKKAFTGKNSLQKNPLYLDVQKTVLVPDKVKIVEQETVYTIRKSITPDLKIDKVIDVKVRSILQKRLDDFNGNSKEAFSNLEENPIWQNKEKGIKLKSVTITGISNAIALHSRINKEGKEVPVDFVNTGNNHHVAVYRDSEGNLQEKVVSLFEAVARKSQGLNPIDKEWNQEIGWRFEFTMKQNEYFIFPHEANSFDPKEIELTNPDNYKFLSQYLYRVQKLATKNYMFRHHLETSVSEMKELANTAFINIRSTAPLDRIVKVRINHIGQIVGVGEY